MEQQVAQAHITPNAAWMNIAKGGQGQGWGSNLYDVYTVVEFLGIPSLEILSKESNQMITLSSNALFTEISFILRSRFGEVCSCCS